MSDTTLDDSALVKAAASGSREAFADLVQTYQDRIFRVILNLVRDDHLAEDLTQDVFVKVYQKLGTFNFQSSFFTWLYRIAINTAMDGIKRNRRRRALSLDEKEGISQGLRSAEEAPDSGLHENEMKAAVHRALDSLSPKYRTVMVLREFENLTYEEIARVMSCSVGTVESRLFRARAKFREKMRIFYR
ncbi:MAG: sigma-70 family RNA polymerase sigma factor [Planctomycetota bacterium]